MMTIRDRLNWSLISEDFQCDIVCRPHIERVPGMGSVCTGCGANVVLVPENLCREIEIEAEIIEQIEKENADQA